LLANKADTLSDVNRLLILGLLGIGLALAAPDVKEGNFTIRFEPSAKLQTNVEVPFDVRITDDRNNPLQSNAKVELAIAPENQAPVKTVKAWFVQPGLFIAKPVFPYDGQWAVTVTARINDRVTARTITFTVAE
jgi:hypothetical protein